MNSTERVMAATRFEALDRIPVWDNYWGHFPENWRRYMKLGPSVNPTDYYGIDVSICVADECFFPSSRRLIRTEGEYEIWNNGWGRTVRRGTGDSSFDDPLDSVLDDPGDLDKIEFEPAALERRYDAVVTRAAAEREAGRCVFAKVGGIYCRSQFIRGEERLLTDMVLDSDFCDALFDRVVEHRTAMALETLKRIEAWATGLWVFDDMAGTNVPTFSPDMFGRYMLPRYRKMISTLRDAGCAHVFFHSDGNIGPLLDMLLEAGFEGFNPLEPRSGLGLVGLREKYGKRFTCFGGICNTRILPRGNKKEIEAHARPLIELAREGGIVLGSASISGDVPPEAYDYYVSLVKKYGECSSVKNAK